MILENKDGDLFDHIEVKSINLILQKFKCRSISLIWTKVSLKIIIKMTN